MEKTEIFMAAYSLLKICNDILSKEHSSNLKPGDELSELGRTARRRLIDEAETTFKMSKAEY